MDADVKEGGDAGGKEDVGIIAFEGTGKSEAVERGYDDGDADELSGGDEDTTNADAESLKAGAISDDDACEDACEDGVVVVEDGVWVLKGVRDNVLTDVPEGEGAVVEDVVAVNDSGASAEVVGAGGEGVGDGGGDGGGVGEGPPPGTPAVIAATSIVTPALAQKSVENFNMASCQRFQFPILCDSSHRTADRYLLA